MIRLGFVADPAYTVRAFNPQLDGSLVANCFGRRLDGHYWPRRKEKQKDGNSENREESNNQELFHFLTQESIQSMNVLYQRMEFCGLSTQCPSSGNNRSLEGTF